MARLPQPGADDGVWGNVLNDFLSVAHNTDGTLKNTGNLAAKADDSSVVHTSGDESISGVKTFNNSPVVPTPSIGVHVANKAYVDSSILTGTPDATTVSKGFVQLAGDLSGTAASPSVVATHLASALPVNQGGTGSTSQNFVDLSNTQTIGGAKTFSSTITVPTPLASSDAATKSYVDSSVVTANNGLTKTGNAIQLGGSLTAATNVTLGGSTLGFINSTTDKTEVDSTGFVKVTRASGASSFLEGWRSGESFARASIDGFGTLHFGGLGSAAAPLQIGKDATNTGYINIQNTVGPVSLITLDSNTANAGGPDAESTLSLRVFNTSGTEYIDYYHNNYSSSGDVQYGVMIGKTSSASYEPYYWGYSDQAVTAPTEQVRNREVLLTINPDLGIGAATGLQETGTASVTSGSTTVTGSGTLFTSQFSVGDSIKVGTVSRIIASITSDTVLNTTVTWAASASAQNVYLYNRARGRLGVRIRTPSAFFHIAGGIGGSTVGSASLKLNPATALLTTPESGAMEYDGSHLYFTAGGTRYQIDQQASSGSFVDLSTAQSIGGVKTFTNAPVLSPITAPGSPSTGQVWSDSAQQSLTSYQGGIKVFQSGTLYVSTATVNHTNTATGATELIGSGVGTIILPANFFVAGKTVRIKVFGLVTTASTTSPSYNIQFELGANQMAATGAQVFPTNMTTREFMLETYITCRSSGASGSLISEGWLQFTTSATGTPTVWEMANAGAGAFDTTAAQQMHLYGTWGATSPSGCTFSSKMVIIESLS